MPRLGLEQWAQGGRCRVGHEHVQRAELSAYGGEHLLDVIGFTEVGLHDEGAGAEILQRPCGVARSLFVAAVVHDARVAVAGERLVNRSSDAPRGAGYEREFLLRQGGFLSSRRVCSDFPAGNTRAFARGSPMLT